MFRGTDTFCGGIWSDLLVLAGKMCAGVFTNNSMGEVLGVSGFELGLNVPTNLKQQTSYKFQRSYSLRS